MDCRKTWNLYWVARKSFEDDESDNEVEGQQVLQDASLMQAQQLAAERRAAEADLAKKKEEEITAIENKYQKIKEKLPAEKTSRQEVILNLLAEWKARKKGCVSSIDESIEERALKRLETEEGISSKTVEDDVFYFDDTNLS